MAKKKNLNLVSLLIAGLSLIAFIMMFLTAIKVDAGIGEVTTYSGLNVIFGHSETMGSLSQEVFKFSFMNLIPYLLIIAVIVLSVLSFLKGNKLFTLIAIALAIIAGVLLLFTVQFTVLPSEMAQKSFDAMADEGVVKLGAGPIVGAIAMFVSAVLGVLKTVFDK